MPSRTRALCAFPCAALALAAAHPSYAATIDTDPTRKGDQDFRFIGTQNFDGRTGELHYQTFDQPGTANDITVISGDINGDRVADFEIELTGIIKPTSGDFLL